MLFIAQESKTCPYDSQAPRMQASSAKRMIDTCFIVFIVFNGYAQIVCLSNFTKEMQQKVRLLPTISITGVVIITH